jgi:S1-C subfamily serine protease
MNTSTAIALALILLPGAAWAQRAQSPSDATVYIRLIGSVHAEIDDGGGHRTMDLDHVELASGSGFLISPYGYILTNEHVIANGEELLVSRAGTKAKITMKVSRIDACLPRAALATSGLLSQCLEASVSASDAALDLAVLFVSASNLPYIALGDSDAVAAGVPVDALGYPFGRDVEVGKMATAPDLVPEVSTTPGNISALRPDEAGDRRYLQVTNTLNPGNSGGPLLDRDGFALGIIRMKLVGATGIGFAIPINEAKNFLESHGLDQLMPTRRLRLGPFQRLEPKGIGLRMVEGLADISPFRSHVETESRDASVTLRIDRVVSPLGLKQIEQALIGSHSFEPGSLMAEPTPAAAGSNGGPILGRATGTGADGKRPVSVEYAVVGLGAEKLVARYVGAPEQIAYNESVLRESLASLEGTRFLAPGTDRADAVEWSTANNQNPLPAPAGWIAEPGGPSACPGLPQPTAVMTFFSPTDSTVTLRAAFFADGIRPDAAASACSTRRGSLGSASYATRAEFLGVSYLIEGVFAPTASAHVVQLEAVAPDQKTSFARAMLAAWLKRTAQ